MNSNAYVVVSRRFENGKIAGEAIIDGVFSSEEKAKEFIDKELVAWLKLQNRYDKLKEFSGSIKFGDEYAEQYEPYLTWDIRIDANGIEKYWTRDIECYDYD